MPKHDILTTLGFRVEDEGYEKGTPQYERRLTSMKVEKCMEMQGVMECSSCRAYMDCELAKDHERQKAFGPKT